MHNIFIFVSWIFYASIIIDTTIEASSESNEKQENQTFPTRNSEPSLSYSSKDEAISLSSFTKDDDNNPVPLSEEEKDEKAGKREKIENSKEESTLPLSLFHSLYDPYLQETFERIRDDLHLSQSLPLDDSLIDIIVTTLEENYTSRALFYQNCKSYSPLILSKIIKQTNKKEILMNTLSLDCLERTTNLDISTIADMIWSSSRSLAFFLENSTFPLESPTASSSFSFSFSSSSSSSFTLLSSKITRIINEFPALLVKFPNERLCDYLINTTSSSHGHDDMHSSSISPSVKWKLMLTCIYNFPFNSKFINAIPEIIIIDDSNNDIVPFNEIIDTIDSFPSFIFLSDSLKSIKNNEPDSLIVILQNWKRFIELIFGLKRQWENDEPSLLEICSRFKPVYSLKSIIFFEEYTCKDLELVGIFKKFPTEKILSIREIILDIDSFFSKKKFSFESFQFDTF